jgi:hypothetical protein
MDSFIQVNDTESPHYTNMNKNGETLLENNERTIPDNSAEPLNQFTIENESHYNDITGVS